MTHLTSLPIRTTTGRVRKTLRQVTAGTGRMIILALIKWKSPTPRSVQVMNALNAIREPSTKRDRVCWFALWDRLLYTPPSTACRGCGAIFVARSLRHRRRMALANKNTTIPLPA